MVTKFVQSQVKVLIEPGKQVARDRHQDRDGQRENSDKRWAYRPDWQVEFATATFLTPIESSRASATAGTSPINSLPTPDSAPPAASMFLSASSNISILI